MTKIAQLGMLRNEENIVKVLIISICSMISDSTLLLFNRNSNFPAPLTLLHIHSKRQTFAVAEVEDKSLREAFANKVSGNGQNTDSNELVSYRLRRQTKQ